MKELFEQLIESAKTNKAGFYALKHAIVKCQQFELAGKLREIEKEAFPETEEIKKAKEDAGKLNVAFRMVGLTVSNDLCWLIDETMKEYRKKKGKFDMDTATRLMVKKRDLFLEDE